MISPEKRDANRNNARKSTGPKSAEGKARSARNAVTHGLTASPGDPTEAFRSTLAEWVGDLKPQGIVERTLTERACRAAWNLSRCDRFEDATTAKRVRDAAELHDSAEIARAETLGRRLIHLPISSDTDATEAAKSDPSGEDDPALLVAELRRFAAGVSWLLARWAELAGGLKSPGGWDDSRRSIAFRLLGLRLDEAGDHPVLGRWTPTPIGMPGHGSWLDRPALAGALDAAIESGERGLGEPKTIWIECVRAVARRERGELESTGTDRKKLAALVRSERAKLARLMRRVLKTKAVEDRVGAADRTMFEESKALSLCLRYATAASRDLHRSITDLARLRKAKGDDPGEEDEPPQPPDSPSDPASPGPRADDPSATEPSEKLRNEATEARPAANLDDPNRAISPIAPPRGMASKRCGWRSSATERLSDIRQWTAKARRRQVIQGWNSDEFMEITANTLAIWRLGGSFPGFRIASDSLAANVFAPKHWQTNDAKGTARPVTPGLLDSPTILRNGRHHAICRSLGSPGKSASIRLDRPP